MSLHTDRGTLYPVQAWLAMFRAQRECSRLRVDPIRSVDRLTRVEQNHLANAEDLSWPPIDLGVVRRRLMLVEIDSLLTYEVPRLDCVAEIAESLSETQTLLNPVVVDLDLGLLIDGHHRARAFRGLRQKRIPAYVVDYRSAAVEVRGWRRTTTAPPAEVREVFGAARVEPREPCSVVSVDSRKEVIARRFFRTQKLGAEHLEFVSGRLSVRGFDDTLEPMSSQVPLGRIASYVEPVVGKEGVLAVALAGDPFPHEVNRHLVDGRPLGMNVPLACLSSPSTFQGYVDSLFECCSPELTNGGKERDGRLYEERVTLFGSSPSIPR
jgi:hypothetical protein